MVNGLKAEGQSKPVTAGLCGYSARAEDASMTPMSEIYEECAYRMPTSWWNAQDECLVESIGADWICELIWDCQDGLGIVWG